ncbi:MAG TPA: tRNA lysidine(34) synthetase TilS [Terriglobia bacterium]|nr:tRNA lysidine(34) synthetase TilS [Terriglobia bacterium]
MPHRPDTYTRWVLEMRHAQLFQPGWRVGVAVSGGPDSVLLLDFLHRLAAEVGLSIAAVHFNHHLRGAESDADEQFVGDLARALGIEFIHAEADTARIARQRHRNLEATARDLRYRFFFSLVNQGRLERMATAHTANDQAETVLLRLVRGAGTRGLGGIHPVLDGKIVRPFLNLTRAEVEAEIARRKLRFRVDSSNLDTRFARNKIRQQLLPLIEREYNPGAVRLLKQLADRARDDESFLERASADRAQPWLVREGNEERIPTHALSEFPPALQRRVLRQMIAAACRGPHSSPGRVTYDAIEALRRLALQGQSGKRLTLPGGLAARRDFEWLAISFDAVAAAPTEYSFAVTLPCEITVPQLGVVFRFQVSEFPDTPATRKAYNQAGLALDAGKLSPDLLLRNWRAGDRFQPLGSRRSSKLKELFQERKVPQQQRELWPVLECAGTIVWVRGFPPSSTAAISGSCRRVLSIEERPLARKDLAPEFKKVKERTEEVV